MDKKIWYAPNGFEAYGDEEINAVTKCLREGWLAGNGKYTTQFEQEVAEYFGKRYGLFVNSGSSACLLALASLNLPKGTEVITPACTFSTTVAPIIQSGYKPVFCDVELRTYVASVASVLAKITPATRVIMLPNLIGNTPDWKELRRNLDTLGRTDIFLIEDSADTMTCTPDTDISTVSFYASHVITACGSGGMVMFNDAKYLKRATMFRDWGRIGDNTELVVDRFNHSVDDIKYDYKFLYGCLGYNFKSSEVNAAFGLEQMKKLPRFVEIRRRNIERYLENLKDVKGILLPSDTKNSNWLAFPFQVNDRLALVTYLEDRNVQTRVIFSGNITRHPAYREYLKPFPNADLIMRNGILLGCHHGMTLEDVDHVCGLVIAFMRSLEPNPEAMHDISAYHPQE
jgi:CDP-6-deoxy-D-xylo-4-hexulose-3-dehydrase